jgi:hypothetical protein
MALCGLLTTAEIKALFAEEINAAGGRVSDIFDDGDRLFVRSVLPSVREVRTADQLQAGVALRAGEHDVLVHPYVFRLVCRNGAIMAHAIQTRHVEVHEFTTPQECIEAVREAIQVCCDEEAFTGSFDEIRFAIQTPADMALNMLPMLSRLPTGAATEVFRSVAERFFQEADQSRFGLMNAVTSLARDTADPELRWRLEELGGGVPAGRTPVRSTDPCRLARQVKQFAG